MWQPFPACHLTWRFPNYGSTHEHRPTLKPEYITQQLVHRWSPPPHTNHQGTVPSVFVVHVCMYRYTNIATIVLPYWSKIKSCKVCVCVCVHYKKEKKNTLNNDILLNMKKEATLWRKNTTWAGSEGLWGNEAWNALASGFVMLQLEILISYVAGPNFQFRCDERGVRMGCLK